MSGVPEPVPHKLDDDDDDEPIAKNGRSGTSTAFRRGSTTAV